MNKEKLKGYESPTAEVLEVKIEGVICESMSIQDWDDGITIDF